MPCPLFVATQLAVCVDRGGRRLQSSPAPQGPPSRVSKPCRNSSPRGVADPAGMVCLLVAVSDRRPKIKRRMEWHPSAVVSPWSGGNQNEQRIPNLSLSVPLLDKHHLPRLREVSRLQPAEIHAGRQMAAVEPKVVRTGREYSVGQHRHRPAHQVHHLDARR
jgi:hypothetical protein